MLWREEADDAFDEMLECYHDVKNLSEEEEDPKEGSSARKK